MFSDVFLSEQASTAIRILKTQNKQATEYTEKCFQVSNNEACTWNVLCGEVKRILSQHYDVVALMLSNLV